MIYDDVDTETGSVVMRPSSLVMMTAWIELDTDSVVFVVVQGKHYKVKWYWGHDVDKGMRGMRVATSTLANGCNSINWILDLLRTVWNLQCRAVLRVDGVLAIGLTRGPPMLPLGVGKWEYMDGESRCVVCTKNREPSVEDHAVDQ